MPIRLANTKTVQRHQDEALIYVGRGRAPTGMEHAQLGNPFRVGGEYAQGEAASAYLDYLRKLMRQRGPEYRTIKSLASRLVAGEHLVICCWCHPRPCHGEHIMAAIKGYARQLG